MQPASDLTVEAIKTALTNNTKVLLAGGPGGSYGPAIERDDRFEQLISHEANARKDRDYIVPRGVGCVLISHMLSVALTRNIVQQCEYRKIPVYGTFRSAGMIKRACDLARAMVPQPPKAKNGHHAPPTPTAITGSTSNGLPFNNTHQPTAPRNGLPTDAQLAQEEQAATVKLAQVDHNVTASGVPEAAVVAASALVQPVDVPSVDTQLETVRSLFADARTALDLAEEAFTATMLAAKNGLEAQRRLAQLENIFKTTR